MKRSPSKFGLTDADWETAKQELRSAILQAAGDRRMTCYSEVAPQVHVTNVDAYSTLLNYLLGEISSDEHAEGRPLLTAIVTHKDGDREPGPGFYEMARSLGYRFADPVVFWAAQVQEVFKLHGRPSRAG
jgi:hypothetical protein